ncbi:MAG TPA: hypothetical protein VMB25_10785 [Bryobacteraceae bacterium]|nr:hypothetical protein [Bryobacteraceae bacterium]
MPQFPNVDPIPLPAPIWLFKVLHNLTFALHLASVELLLGGLLMALLFVLAGRALRREAPLQSAGVIVHRLPTLMAFVINLGVPPLLFAQVLYGRALYTSSVLIGTYWISVIFLLMASYYGLYLAARRAETGRPWTVPGFAALVLALTIAFIYSNNMTLMLRPQSWVQMYQSNPHGFQLNTDDPTLFVRWFFFLAGAFPATGAALALLSLRSVFSENVRRFLARSGGVAIAAGALVQATFGYLALEAQPSDALSTVMGDALYRSFALGWLATAALLVVAGLLLWATHAARAILAVGGALAAFLNIACTVMVRDGIRDVTLRAAGFDVWNRQVVTNWSVVGLFLVLFVAALAVIAYLITVIAKARRLEEKYAEKYA